MSVSRAESPTIGELRQEASEYLSHLSGPQKDFMQEISVRLEKCVENILHTGRLPPDFYRVSSQSKEEMSEEMNEKMPLARYLSVQWQKGNEAKAGFKVEDKVLEQIISKICKLCILNAIEERDGIKRTPPRPIPTTPLSLNLEPHSKSESPSEKVPDSPRRRLLMRRNNRSQSAPEPRKNSSPRPSPRGPLQFVMPTDQLTPEQTIEAIESTFKKLPLLTQEQVLQGFKKGGKISKVSDPLQMRQIQSIEKMFQQLSSKEHKNLLRKLSAFSK